ncbi:MAG TPA: ABC transporter permease [Verrucomicrobiota bacterium]|jgi:putative ABC transport system permease protein|nr:ABC transporter permease [Verrucomicrobiota bacterium]HRT07057.1 ABC transporter permease [Candidatus Paceibacterota bacterium]HRT56560.1 ABC transporter permease [Candidatus Paceibacterota bacterium]
MLKRLIVPYQFVITVRLGIKSLLLHKLRSSLTMLGIIFGVCSVIAMLAIGEGASYEAQEAIKKLGSNNILIRSLKPPEQARQQGMGGPRGMQLKYGLTYADSGRLMTTIPGVVRLLPMRIIRENVRFGQNEVPCQIIGTLPFYPEVGGAEVVRGRFLAPMDEQHQENVCVITTGLARRLFPIQDPLEHSVRIDTFYYRVIGIIQERSQPEQRTQAGKMEGQPLDNNVYIPLSTSRTRFGEILFRRSAGSFEAEEVQLHQITVQMRDTAAVETADPQIKTLLGRFHDQNDYEIIVPLQLLRQAEQTKRIFSIVLGSIAAISLLVGGIGIMNIMLATVTERTREIGIRRALGAKRSDITLQFLVETVVLSVGGGLIGVMVGILVPILVSSLTTMKTIVTPWSVLLAFSISGAVGIIFGLYPAKAAAKLDPIEALRHE